MGFRYCFYAEVVIGKKCLFYIRLILCCFVTLVRRLWHDELDREQDGGEALLSPTPHRQELTQSRHERHMKRWYENLHRERAAGGWRCLSCDSPMRRDQMQGKPLEDEGIEKKQLELRQAEGGRLEVSGLPDVIQSSSGCNSSLKTSQRLERDGLRVSVDVSFLPKPPI